MTEKPVSIHTIDTPHFTMRIFSRRAKFSNRCAHIAEVCPKGTIMWAPIQINGAVLASGGMDSYCGWKAKVAYINFSRPSRLLLSRAVAEELIPSLAKRNLPALSYYKIFRYAGSTSTGVTSCKESAVSYLVSYRAHRGYKEVTLQNNLPLTEREQKSLLKWAAKFGGLEFIDDKTLQVSDWWCQDFIKAGWLLLALRVANGEYIMPSRTMEEAFQYFMDNGTVLTPGSWGWGSSVNWQYHFERNKLPYFEGGMAPPA